MSGVSYFCCYVCMHECRTKYGVHTHVRTMETSDRQTGSDVEDNGKCGVHICNLQPAICIMLILVPISSSPR